MNLLYPPSKRYAEVLRKVTCDHWVPEERRNSHQAWLVCVLNGVRLSYGTHDGGNEWNSARNFAADMEKACGCKLIDHRNRRRSRKAFRPSGYTPKKSSNECEIAEEIEALIAEWDAIEALFESAVMSGERPDDALGMALRRQQIAARLEELYKPVPASKFPLAELD